MPLLFSSSWNWTPVLAVQPAGVGAVGSVRFL